MNIIYICRVSDFQVAGNQIDIPKKVAIDFFNVSERDIELKNNVGINLCHISDLRSFEIIEIQPATNMRWSTKLNSFLSDHDDELTNGCLLLFEKLGRSFCVHTIKDNDMKYSALVDLFEQDERHMLLSAYFNKENITKIVNTNNITYLTALRTKPFMLLAGISGTGKSRIVRELAKACWKDGDEEYGDNNPRNFCMVQVKPNWHDSTELLGYVSRISGKPEFVAGDFLRFVVKAWEEPNVPYFLCLDEMNLAPVEQYFAEYLSVIESRKSIDGIITTDPLLKNPYENKEFNTPQDYGEEMDWYKKLLIQLTPNDSLRKQFYDKGISIPQNLFVVGTVNMDETTFSFSRKVLDRAMTIEMNEVDLHGGLEDNGSDIGYIGNSIIGDAVEGKDIYASNKELCDNIISYLEKVNSALEGSPFKIAYRTRNEFLLYAVNRLLLNKDSQIWQTLDEMTSMKILSRIEGDSERTQKPLTALQTLAKEAIEDQIPEPKEGEEKAKSITAIKIKEMLRKIEESSYTSYWA